MILRRLCKGAVWASFALYLLALSLMVIGTFGLFGAERDPLAGVFLIPLGLPWNQLVDQLPEPLWPWFAAAAPALNILILALVCHLLGAARPGKSTR